MDDRILNEWSYIIASSYRIKTLKSLSQSPKIPTEIAKEHEIPTCRISKTLSDLKEHNLVFCVNPEMKKGRIYKITEYGHEVLNQIISNEK